MDQFFLKPVSPLNGHKTVKGAALQAYAVALAFKMRPSNAWAYCGIEGIPPGWKKMVVKQAYTVKQFSNDYFDYFTYKAFALESRKILIAARKLRAE